MNIKSIDNHDVEWTDSEINELREAILRNALVEISHDDFSHRSLGKTEALMVWILDDSIHPFSYRICCIASGVDADEIRHFLVRTYMNNNRSKLKLPA